VVKQKVKNKNKDTNVDDDAIFEILLTGQIKFNRDLAIENRELVMDVMKDLIEDTKQLEEIEKFLNGAEDIDVIFGDRILCG
jgi:hypothetical protein